MHHKNIKGKKIRVYKDIDCDCGKRRNKREKSPYVIGYRLHTLTAIDAVYLSYMGLLIHCC